ncbi:CU044_2847 family protein [Streptomyces sp. NPDC050803]|uniref:CU044_2847 family protein n=1 Tax=unclassified Streptomyces TaxID=2593676 RepID=UPI0034192B5D
MGAYVSFDSEAVMVEITPSAPSPPGKGPVKAGVGDRLRDGVVQAQQSFEDALGQLIRHTAGAFVRAANSLDDAPTDIEVEFSVKVTGEAGSMVIGKLGGEAHYGVKLAWSKS